MIAVAICACVCALSVGLLSSGVESDFPLRSPKGKRKKGGRGKTGTSGNDPSLLAGSHSKSAGFFSSCGVLY